MKPPRLGRPPKRRKGVRPVGRPIESGIEKLRTTFRELANRGVDPIDRRTKAGRAIAEWKQTLIQDLGGPEAVSAQQRVIIDLAARSKILLDTVDAYVFSMRSLVNRKTRQLYPVVRERFEISNALAGYMSRLGLERREKPLPSLQEYLASLEKRTEDTDA